MSGSCDNWLRVWDVSTDDCHQTLTGHTNWARRRRPADTTCRSLVDAATGAGQRRRCPAERQHRVRVARPHAQGLGRVDRRLPPDITRARERSAAPASSRTARRRLASTRRAQVRSVAVLLNGNIVSGSGDNTLKVWDASSERCLQTLRGHMDSVRRRRPVKPRVDRSSTPRRAQVLCVAVLSNGDIVSGSLDRTLKVWVDYAKMARLVALRRLRGMNVKTAGRLIARFL